MLILWRESEPGNDKHCIYRSNANKLIKKTQLLWFVLMKRSQKKLKSHLEYWISQREATKLKHSDLLGICGYVVPESGGKMPV